MRTWMPWIVVLMLVSLVAGCSQSAEEQKADQQATWGPLLAQREGLLPQLREATQAWRELRGPMELANNELTLAKKSGDEERKTAAKAEYDRLVGAYTTAHNRRQELDTQLGDVEFRLKKLGWTPPPAASSVPEVAPAGGTPGN